VVVKAMDAKVFSGETDTFYDEIPMAEKKEVKVEGIYWGEMPYTADAGYKRLAESTEIVRVKAEKPVSGDTTSCVREMLDGLTDGYHIVFYNEGNSDALVEELKECIKTREALKSKVLVEVSKDEAVPASENATPRIVVWKEFSGEVKLRSIKSDLYVIDKRHHYAEDEKHAFEKEIDFSRDNCVSVTGETDLFSNYRERTVSNRKRTLTEETARYMEKAICGLVDVEEKNKKLDAWMKAIYGALGGGDRGYIYPSDAAQHYDVILGKNDKFSLVDNSTHITQNNYHITQINNNISITQTVLDDTILKQIKEWYGNPEFYKDIKEEDGGLEKYEKLLEKRLHTIQLQKAKLEGQLELQAEGSDAYNALKAKVEECAAEEMKLHEKLNNLEDSFEEDLGKAFEENGKLSDTQVCEVLAISPEEYTELKEVLNLNNVISGEKDYNRKFLNAVYVHKSLAEYEDPDTDYSSASIGYGTIAEGMLKRLHAKIYDARFCTTAADYQNETWKRWWSDKKKLMMGSFTTHLENSGSCELTDIHTGVRSAVERAWKQTIDGTKLKKRLDGLSFSCYASSVCAAETVTALDGSAVTRNSCYDCGYQSVCPVHIAWKEHSKAIEIIHKIRNSSGHDKETEASAVTKADIDKMVEAMFQKSARDGMSGCQRIIQLYCWYVGNHDYWERPTVAPQQPAPAQNVTPTSAAASVQSATSASGTTPAQPVQSATTSASAPAQSTAPTQTSQARANGVTGITEALLNGYKTNGKKLLFWCNGVRTLAGGTTSWTGMLRLPEGDVLAYATGEENILANVSEPRRKHYTVTITEVKQKNDGTLYALIQIQSEEVRCVFKRTGIATDSSKWFGSVLWDGVDLNRKTAAFLVNVPAGLQADTTVVHKSYEARVISESQNAKNGKTEFKVEILSVRQEGV